jgi:hypothetical protein
VATQALKLEEVSREAVALHYLMLCHMESEDPPQGESMDFIAAGVQSWSWSIRDRLKECRDELGAIARKGGAR